MLAIITLIGTIVSLGIGFLILSAYGERSGVEFSPDDFSMRKFDYCNLPLINWTRRGIKYSDAPNGNAATLIADDWIRVTGRTPKRWHLVSETGGQLFPSGRMPSDCDARFLTEYFDTNNNSGENWIMNWTNDNPKSAKRYWPLIAEMARDELYLPIPGLMEFVLDYPNSDKDENFEAALLKRVSEAWYQAGITDQRNGSHQRAVKRFEMAISKDESHPEALQAKSISESASQ